MDIRTFAEAPPPVSTGPKIGRIVTCYGQWKMIERWIYNEQLIQPHVAWIFVNDKPSDPLPDRLKEQVARFGCVIEPPVNMGRCCARNLGISHSLSEWIDLIDGDDIPYPIACDFDRDVGEAGQIYFEVDHHREIDGAVVPEREEEWIPPAENRFLKALIGNWDARPICIMWKREVIVRLGGFDSRAEYGEDLNLAIRARLADIPYTTIKLKKGSYQRETAGRQMPLILPLAELWNWEMARPLVAGEMLELLEEKVRHYRKLLLWTGMREMEKSKSSVWEKLCESGKWILGKHKTKP